MSSASVRFKGEIKDFKEENPFRTKNTHDNKHGEALVGGKVAHGCKKLRRRRRGRVTGGRAAQPLSEEKKEVAARGCRRGRPGQAVS